MALFKGDIYSEVLQLNVPLTVYLPQDDREYRSAPEREPHTLILLHGLGSNSSGWTRYTSIERYARARNLTLVCPDCNYSFYTNMSNGKRYADYVCEELPDLLGRMFKVRTDRGGLSIAGLSMGGYGALRAALTHPQTFGSCASFSGALLNGDPQYLEELRAYDDPAHGRTGQKAEGLSASVLEAALGIYGDDIAYRQENDLVQLVKGAAAAKTKLPKILMTCGTEDFLYRDNRTFYQTLTELGIPASFHVWHGIHDWKFWEECAARYLDFFAEKG